MPPGKLQHSILVTLGLTLGACGDKGEEDSGEIVIGPCLSVSVDSGGGGDDSGSDDSGSDDSGSDDSSSSDSRSSDSRSQGSRAQVTRRVIASGILPADVSKLLAKRIEDI